MVNFVLHMIEMREEGYLGNALTTAWAFVSEALEGLGLNHPPDTRVNWVVSAQAHKKTSILFAPPFCPHSIF